jgi:tetratricopeptide (TPR) repeat protein
MNLQESRKIPMKQTAFVCIVVIALGAGTACIATKETYLSRGNKLFDAGKYADASLNYQKAIQKDPKFGEAYYGLGLSAIKQNQGKVAYDALYRAVQLLPNRVEVSEKFADVCLSYYLADRTHPQFLYKQITQVSDELLAKNANSYEGLMLRGYLNLTDQKPKEAIQFFQKALQVDPSNAGVTMELVRLLLVDGQTQAGEKLATDMITRDKAYGPIYDTMYDWYAKSGRVADAENMLKIKVKNNPQQADYLIQLAHYYRGAQKPLEMKSTLQRLLDDPKDFPDGRLWVGDFYLRTQDPTAALQYYQDALRSTEPKEKKVIYQKRSVIALLRLGKKEEATSLAAKVVSENPEDLEAKRLHADLLLGSRKPEIANAAVREFQALVTQNPADAGLRLQLARADRSTGSLEAARAQLKEAINRQKNFFPARYELAEISLAQQRPEEALQQANEILKSAPRDRPARLLRTRALIDTHDLVTARSELSELIKESPQDPLPQLQLGLLALQERKYADAINIFNKHLADGDGAAFSGLCDAYLAQRQLDKAREIAKEGLKVRPTSPQLLEQLASIEGLAGHYDVAIAEFQDQLANDPKSVHLLRRLGEVCDLKGDLACSIKYYQQALDLEPNNLTLALTLADALARGGRVNEARAHYLGVVKAYPENASALNNAAFFLADSGGDLDEALRFAQSALAKVPGQPGFSDTIGYVYLKKGLSDTAVKTFDVLVRKYPEYAGFRYHLGLALYARGDKAGARRELQAALDKHPSPQDKVRIKELLDKIGRLSS